MEEQIEFISETELSSDELFLRYFDNKILPLIEENNKLKETYISRFWGYLWSACFILGANTLIILFRYLMYHYPISYGQILLLTLIVAGVVLWPLYQYYRIPKNNVFDAFLKYYGNFQYSASSEAKVQDTPILPPHETTVLTHAVVGQYDNTEIAMNEALYQSTVHIKKWHFKRTVSFGTMVNIKFDKNFNNKIYLFDKGGFYRKNRYPDLENITARILIPAANYFNIFTKDEEYAKDMLPSAFLEHILDMKDIFAAKHLYLQMEDECMRIYLEGTKLYFACDHLWGKINHKDKFLALHHKIEQILYAIQLVHSLKDAI